MNPAGERPAKAAFEIGKGPRQVMTLSESDVERCLDPGELLDGLEDGFRGLELGDVQSPPRPALTVPPCSRQFIWQITARLLSRNLLRFCSLGAPNGRTGIEQTP